MGSATSRRTEACAEPPSEHHVEIDAPAALLYDLVADLGSMADLSPECEACWWVGDSTMAVPGALFRGRSRRGRRRWTTTSEIIDATPGRRISWKVTYWSRPVACWSYDFASLDADRTVVTERCVDQRRPILRRMSAFITGATDRAARNDDTMRTTLARLKLLAESEGPPIAARSMSSRRSSVRRKLRQAS